MEPRPSQINRRGSLSTAGTLFVNTLSVASSHATDTAEDDPTGPPDTMQWWIGASESFRIRTYALDHDIHIHHVASGGPEVVDLARGNAERTYADLITMQRFIVLDDPDDDEAVTEAFRAVGLDPNLEIADRFSFGSPIPAVSIEQRVNRSVDQGPLA